MFFAAAKPSTDERAVSELLTRGVERVYPSPEFLEKKLKSGERLTVYLGIDPTGPTLHLGHVIPLLKLRQFQRLGHRVILLIGDFTATIGDPTDKLAARKTMTLDEALSHARMYKKQANRALSFRGRNAAEIKHNSQWLGALSYADFHRLASLVTVEQLIKRDMFAARQAAGKPIHLHEFVYPLLQGYDSVAMRVDGEVGGNDQTFNMLVGRDLVAALRGREKFVIAMKLLADHAGRKMGKTEGNMVSFSDAPGDSFGKVMSWPDEMIVPGFELCTIAALSEVWEAKRTLEAGTNPKELKLKLAEAVVSLLHGEARAAKARAAFEAAFAQGRPEDFVAVFLNGKEVAEALVGARVVSSKSELRRLIGEGAITNLDTGEKAGEGFVTSAPAGKYRLGKRRFIEIR